MAVSGVSGRSSSIYGNRNVITGLASGMDTESMIENAISAYKNKISALTQKRTKTEWRQEAYRSMVDKMSSFLTKYTSYRSSNNLMSTSFFDSAVKTVTKGKYADMVSATGKSSSNVQVNRVKQLASAATYRLSGSVLDNQTSGLTSTPSVSAGDSFDLSAKRPVSTISGSMTLTYGGSSAESRLTINFDEDMLFEGNTEEKAEKIAEEINKQLKEQTVNIGTTSYTGDELLEKVVKAEVDELGNITFTDPKKNNVYISAADKNIRDNLLGGVSELSSVSGKQLKSINAKGVAGNLVDDTKNVGQYLEGGSLTITLDGVQKTVKLPSQKDIIDNLDTKYEYYDALKEKIEKGEELNSPASRQKRDDAFINALQKNIDDAFGEGKFKVKDVANDNSGDKGIRLEFSTDQKGSTFSVYSEKGKTLGMGESKTLTSYLNTNKTLGEILGDDDFKDLEAEAIRKTKKDANGNVMKGEDGKPLYETDADGNPVYETDSKGDILYSFKMNGGKEIGQFSKNTSLQTVMNTINSNSDSGVKVNYSKTTNEFVFTARDSGKNSKIETSGLSEKLFGSTANPPKDANGKVLGEFKGGQDAIFSVSVNGTELKDIERSSNTVDFDGLSINLKGVFGYETDEDGNIQYKTEQAKDEDGNLLFSFQGTQKPARENEAGKLEFADEKTGKTIYGAVGADGKLTFTNQDGNQVYARVDSQNRLRFDADASQAVEAEAVMNKTAIPDTKAEPVTFETSSDADKIVDVVKQMVEDYNAMAKEIKDAYSTLPAQRFNGAYYEPLTAEDEEDMSESAIKNWNDKAKEGLLFGDRDLASLYQRMTSAISMTGENGAALRAAGITVSYSNGLSTLEFNETKFRDALNNDPDKVRDAFTASVESGAKSNGLMQALKQPLDIYGKTEGGKGVLVEKAGSPLAPSTMYNNTIQKELNRIDEEITRWQDKMENQIDHYTNQFSRLEQLIQQMNSQSSYFSQLMGG